MKLCREGDYADFRYVDEARRNLTDSQRSYLRGKRYETEKKLEGRPSITNVLESDTKLVHDAPVKPQSTAAKVAAQTGVSQDTIKRDAQFARAVNCRGTCSLPGKSCPTVANGNDQL